MIKALLGVLSAETLAYLVYWVAAVRKDRARRELRPASTMSLPLGLGIGFGTNFLDTLGIGSFATTTSLFKFLRGVRDELIPGTLNAGHAIPTVAEALIYVSIITVDFRTLSAMIAASILGAWLGAGVVSHWSRRKIQIGLGICLIAAAVLMSMTQLQPLIETKYHLHLIPPGGAALSLSGIRLVIGVVGNFILGALMTLGIGLYAPCMILVSLLGMSPKAAFPIMMGSCAFLMPAGSARFIRERKYDLRASICLAIGGVPGVLIAAYIVRSLPLTYVRWLVVCVVLYTAGMLLHSAAKEARAANSPALPNPAAE
jgi:uncharacterized membrane protein YfcA